MGQTRNWWRNNMIAVGVAGIILIASIVWMVRYKPSPVVNVPVAVPYAPPTSPVSRETYVHVVPGNPACTTTSVPYRTSEEQPRIPATSSSVSWAPVPFPSPTAIPPGPLPRPSVAPDTPQPTEPELPPEPEVHSVSEQQGRARVGDARLDFHRDTDGRESCLGRVMVVNDGPYNLLDFRLGLNVGGITYVLVPFEGSPNYPTPIYNRRLGPGESMDCPVSTMGEYPSYSRYGPRSLVFKATLDGPPYTVTGEGSIQ